MKGFRHGSENHSNRRHWERRMNMYKRFLREVGSTGLPQPPRSPIADFQPASLPQAAQRYLRFMKVADRIPDWSFRLGFSGRFRTGPQRPWLQCEAWQYTSRLVVARIFHIRIRFGGVVPVIGRDTYVQGRGRMLIRMADLFTIDDGTGAEFDIGELVTYLNDAVMIAPSMLLVPEVSWTAVDDSSFEVSLTDHGRTVTGRVFIDDNGAPKDFSTTDRFCCDPEGPKRLIRARWNTPISGWEMVDGRPLPTGGQAVWDLPAGPFAYADFRAIPESIAFNVRPGE
jgi:hypothetical protein